MTSPIARMLASRFAWLSTTPFGSPVLPDVYWMSAVASGFSTCGNGVGAAGVSRLAALSNQTATPAAEHEQVAAMRIALEHLLHQHRKPVEALAHIGVAARQPNLHPARHRDHRRLLRASVSISAETRQASTGPVIRIRPPAANSISITPAAGPDGAAGKTASGAIATAAKRAPSRAPCPASAPAKTPVRACRRHKCS